MAKRVRVQARAVGNAVFLEHEGCTGDIGSFGVSSHTSAKAIAALVNRTIEVALSDELPDILATVVGATVRIAADVHKETVREARRDEAVRG